MPVFDSVLTQKDIGVILQLETEIERLKNSLELALEEMILHEDTIKDIWELAKLDGTQTRIIAVCKEALEKEKSCEES